ncbi:ABC transporter permease [Methylocella sp.]|uniref:ABC transporter permease n=1 Tax=Methylocella sp. TaxID=1978226 RepID=UPI003783AED0
MIPQGLRAAFGRVPKSALVLGLVALACVFGPMLAPHPFDAVYRDHVRVAPSLSPRPDAAALLAVAEDLARRAGASLDEAEDAGEALLLRLSAITPIDAEAILSLQPSGAFGRPRALEARDGGRELFVAVPLTRETFLFGTDANGRDLLARTLWAGRVSLAVGLCASLVALVVGVAYGATAGLAGGALDAAMMRVVEVIYALPFIFFVIMLAMVFGRRFSLIFVAVGAVEWLDMARLARGQTLALKEKDYVAAARALGAGPFDVLRRHILPNAAGPILAFLAVVVARAIVLESFVSFLGLGVQEPLTSWGALIAEGARNIQDAPHLLVAPALFLGLTLAALQSLGQTLEARFALRETEGR